MLIVKEERYRGHEATWWRQSGIAPAERWVQLPEPKARLRVLEVGSGPPVLFLHGGPNAASAFAPLAGALSGFRCLLLDRPGCGLSRAIDYGHGPLERSMTALLNATLDALELERVDLVASSFGGACAFWLAQLFPSRVSSIVQLGCPAFLSSMRSSFFLRLLATPSLGYLVSRVPLNRGGIIGMYKSMGHSTELSPAFVDWYLALASHTATIRSERELIKTAFSWRGMRPDVVFDDEALVSLIAPTLFYLGSRDPFCDVEDIRALASRMKRGKLHLAEAGHLPWLDDVQGAAAQVRSFLSASR